MWGLYIPIGLRISNQQTIRLEFFLHVYFAIHCMHPALNSSPAKVAPRK